MRFRSLLVDEGTTKLSSLLSEFSASSKYPLMGPTPRIGHPAARLVVAAPGVISNKSAVPPASTVDVQTKGELPVRHTLPIWLLGLVTVSVLAVHVKQAAPPPSRRLRATA